MTDFEKLLAEINEYQNTYKQVIAEYIDPIVEIESLFKDEQDYPLAARSGIYCVFNKDKQLIYIGKASVNSTIGNRLCYWFGGKEFRLSGTWSDSPKYLSCFATNHSWEAPSLEEYLIYKLQPLGNRVGLLTLT